MAYGVKKKKKEPVEVADDGHAQLVTWINEADDATITSRQLSEKARDYYDSKQWTEAEVAKLRKQKQAATVINRCKPKMDALMGMEKSAKTTAKAFPRTPKHAKGAEAATEAVRYVLQDNAFDQVRSAVWENILIEGTGACEIIVKPGRNGEMNVIINHIMWDRLVYDQHCRTKSYEPRTCRYLGQVVWMDYDEAIALYPEAKDVLENMTSGSQTYEDKPRWMDGTRRRVKIVELYYRQDGDVWYACFTLGGYCKKPQKSPYINEEGETEWPYEFASPFVDRDGGRYGAMLQLLDVQDEINKRRSKALHLMSVRQVRGERGAVEDVNKAREELAKPDGYIETTPGMEFEVLKTGDMATAQFNLLAEAKAEIDNVGANAATQGKDSTVQSGVALLRRQQAGQTEVGPLFDTLKYWQYRVFRKVWNRIKQYWKDEKWIRVTDDEHNLRWVGLNAPMTKGEMVLEQAQEQGLPPELIQQLQQQIAQDPQMKEPVDSKTLKNDIAQLDVDIILTEVPDVLTAQIEDFQVLGEMVKSGFPMPPIAVIEASPLSNKDKLIKMMKEEQPPSPKIQQAMEQMQEQLKQAGEAAKKLAEENQALKIDQQAAQMKVQADAQAEQGKASMKAQQMAAEHQMAKEIQERDAQLASDKAQSEFDLKREIALRDYELEVEIMNRKHALEQEKAAFEKECKTAESAEKEASSVVPSIERAMTAFGEKLEEVVDILADPPPRTVGIGGLQKDAEGRITGASITTKGNGEAKKWAEGKKKSMGLKKGDPIAEMAESLQQMVKLQTETLAYMKSEKKVSIKGVQKDAKGNITGATLAPTIQ